MTEVETHIVAKSGLLDRTVFEINLPPGSAYVLFRDGGKPVIMEVVTDPDDGSVKDSKTDIAVTNDHGHESRILYDWSVIKKVNMELPQDGIGVDQIYFEAERIHSES